MITEKTKPVLIWQDEFEIDGLPDGSIWSFDVGDACDLPYGCGWGNNELQYYTLAREQNARVEEGHLIIEAHKEPWKNNAYTSARLVSKGKRDLLSGRIEVRAKLPSGNGTVPEIGMLSSDDKFGKWPKSGEIDIMKHVGCEPDTIYGSVHTEAFNPIKGTERHGQIFVPDAESTFHDYVLEWDTDVLRWYVDDKLYHTFEKLDDNPDHWPYDHPFHLILNLAVGGDRGGAKGVDDAIWPQQLLVDYVRIYKI